MNGEVVLIINKGEPSQEVLNFNTVDDAQNAANLYAENTVMSALTFGIYTLYKKGRFGQIVWDYAVDTTTNLIQNAKSNAVPKPDLRSHQRFTNLELDTLKSAHAKGLSPSEIAKKLHRTYKSVYSKMWKLGIVERQRAPRNKKENTL